MVSANPHANLQPAMQMMMQETAACMTPTSRASILPFVILKIAATHDLPQKTMSAQHRLRPNPEDARLSAALASIETIDVALEEADDATRELDDHLIALSSLAFTLSDAEVGGRRGIAEIAGMLDDMDGALCHNKYGAPQGRPG